MPSRRSLDPHAYSYGDAETDSDFDDDSDIAAKFNSGPNFDSRTEPDSGAVSRYDFDSGADS